MEMESDTFSDFFGSDLWETPPEGIGLKVVESLVCDHKQDDLCLYFRIGRRMYALAPWRADFECCILENGKYYPVKDDLGIRLLFNEKPMWRPLSTRERFIESIPVEVRKEFRRYQWLQLTVLRMMRFSKYTFDLVRTNPVLLWMLAHEVSVGNVSYQEYGNLVRQKQKKIIQLCWENSNLSLGLIKRIVPQEYTVEEFDLLFRIVHDPQLAKSFQHYRVVPLGALSRIRFQDDIVNCTFFRRLFKDESEDEWPLYSAVEVFNDTLRCAEGLEAMNPMEVLRKIPDMQSAINLHDRWAGRQRKHLLESYLAGGCREKEFEPFLPGNDVIVHISTLEELLREGNEMRHCVASYAKEFCQCEMSFYKVLYPERCTLAIWKDRKYIHVVDLKKADNCEPSTELKTMIVDWIVSSGHFAGGRACR